MRQRLDTKAIVAEMKQRQVKRITSSMLIARIDDLALNFKKEFFTDSSLAKTNPDSLKKIGQHDGTDIFIGKPDFLKTKTQDPKVQEVLDAYQYNLEKKLPSFANIQKNSEGNLFFYTEPLSKENLFQNASEKTIKSFLSTFDLVGNYKNGNMETTGILMIVFHKNEVIKRMDTKLIK
ncbi:MAG: hypothetical protein KA327_01715 [Pseudarcicella sp.]|nr:hypothetical protein [Pseudarcicella sp.]